MRQENEQVNAAVKEMPEMEGLTRAHGLDGTEYRNILTKVRGARTRYTGLSTERFAVMRISTRSSAIWKRKRGGGSRRKDAGADPRPAFPAGGGRTAAGRGRIPAFADCRAVRPERKSIGRRRHAGKEKTMKIRQATGSVLIVLAAAFTVYLSVVMLRRINAVVLKDSYVKVFRYELAACALFILFAADVRFNLPGGAASGALRAVLILACAALLFFIVKITAGSFIRTEGPARNAIVLGLALENGKPTDDLLARLDAAEKYAGENPEAVLILTGGNPDESGKTEAEVMRDLLAQRGIPEERMILEDRAETTKDNFRNTAELTDPGEPVVLITSGYHMDRAVQTAKSAGFTRILRLPARSSAVYFGANVMWEAVMELNELTLKR